MPVNPLDKPLEQTRQDVIDQLVLNYGHEKLSREAFERRLDEAYDAGDHQALLDLAADLEEFHDRAVEERLDHILYAEPDRAETSAWVVSIFSGTHNNEDIVPATIRMVNIFGGCHLDYSMADFSARETRIKVLCIFGGSHIYVPEGVKVKTRIIPLLGGTRNNAEPDQDPDSPVVIVEGLSLCGGIHVGVKRTFRERMQHVAENIRQMLN